MKIIITEDNFFALRALEEKLSIYDDISIIHRAKNGAELLDILIKDNNIDLILMDIEMPVMNGIDTTEKVKQLYPHIKIVIITINDDDEYICNAIKDGTDS